MQHSRAALDRAIRVAHSWPEDYVPTEVEKDVSCRDGRALLRILNGERAGAA
jgi:hypothetical protein